MPPILTVNIAWNSCYWRHPCYADYHCANWGFRFVRTTRFGYEFWNFDEIDNPYKYIDPQNIQQYSNLNPKNYVFNPNHYYGYFEDLGKQKTIINELEKGSYGQCYGISQNNNGNYNMIIVFTSQDVYKEKRYFVGFYVGDYLKYDERNDNRIYRHKNDIFNVMFH